MSFDDLLTHSVTIVRDALGPEDEHGHATRTPVDVVTVDALVQAMPFRTRGGEEQTSFGGGAETSDHLIFMRAPDISPELNTADRIRYDGYDYEINTIRDAGGQDHHLEVTARLVRPAETGS